MHSRNSDKIVETNINNKKESFKKKLTVSAVKRSHNIYRKTFSMPHSKEMTVPVSWLITSKNMNIIYQLELRFQGICIA
jgi:hypothetical protein